GGFGLVFTILGLLMPSAWLIGAFVTILILCLLFACFCAWWEEHQAHNRALERLKPILDIRDATEVDEGRRCYRVRVENLADQSCMARVHLVGVDPPFAGLPLPLPLKLTNHPETAVAPLPGKHTCLVDVFLWVPVGDRIQIVGTHGAHNITPAGRRLTLSAYS